MTPITKPKVSVIVPVYNVAQYIEKCARSIFEQTLPDLEILFIDDCSPDNSVEIIANTLKQYPQRVPNTRIISMTSNSGSAGARRRGIIESTGQYIIHCDSDDWVDCDLYEKMFNEAVRTNADVVFCDEIYEYANNSIYKNCHNIPKSGKDLLRNWYQHTVGLFCHNKLVRASIYKGNNILPWVGLNMWEDNGLMSRVLYFSDKLSYIEGSYYHYNRANISAMTSSYGINQVRQMIGNAQNITDFFESKPDAEDFRLTAMAFQFLAKLNLITNSFKRLNEYRNIFPGSEKIIGHLDPNAFSSKGKIRFYMVKYHFAWAFVALFKIYSLYIGLRKR